MPFFHHWLCLHRWWDNSHSKAPQWGLFIKLSTRTRFSGPPSLAHQWNSRMGSIIYTWLSHDKNRLQKRLKTTIFCQSEPTASNAPSIITKQQVLGWNFVKIKPIGSIAISPPLFKLSPPWFWSWYLPNSWEQACISDFVSLQFIAQIAYLLL